MNVCTGAINALYHFHPDRTERVSTGAFVNAAIDLNETDGCTPFYFFPDLLTIDQQLWSGFRLDRGVPSALLREAL
jgi:hypothetical protein